MSTSIGKVPTRTRPPGAPPPPPAAAAGQPYRGFHRLLDHLATLTRDQVRSVGALATVPMLTEPASAQRTPSTSSVSPTPPP
jgi:hypothetical protein